MEGEMNEGYDDKYESVVGDSEESYMYEVTSDESITNISSGKRDRKRVGFKEPPSLDVTIDPVHNKHENTYERRRIFSIPEISSLWWSEVDDGEHPEPTNMLEKVQLLVRIVVDHIYIRVLGIFLIILDIVLLIIDLSISKKSPPAQMFFDVMALFLSCLFMMDLFLRIFSYGLNRFFRSKWEVFDGIIVVATFGVTVFYTAIDTFAAEQNPSKDLGRLISLARLIRVIRILRIFYSHKHAKEAGRRTISMNKRRYRKDGFDLDLTYVTEHVIAMSFPSSGIQSFYRNPISEVQRFFETKHPGKYKIYNLCSERAYDPKMFGNCVYRVHIDDHNVPTIKDLMKFMKDAREWTSKDKNNVIAVHCKGGKGRTGTVVCSWLIDQGKFSTAKEALQYFGIRRTDLKVGQTFQGVETASQIRYVGYYEKIKMKYQGIPPKEQQIQVTKIIITSIKGVGRGNGSDLSMGILVDKKEMIKCIFGEEHNCKVTHDVKNNKVVCEVIDCPILVGDVKFRFTSSAKNLPSGYDNCAFYFWVNTGFFEDDHVTIPREELDNPHKKKTWDIYKKDFSVQLYFNKVNS